MSYNSNSKKYNINNIKLCKQIVPIIKKKSVKII